MFRFIADSLRKMDIIKKTYSLFSAILILASFAAAYLFFLPSCCEEFSNEGCTIGVVSGTATPDGRPLLWKVRDNSDMPNNDVVYNSTCKYKFIAVVNSGDSAVWMGVNEKGLSIVNSTAYDLPGTTTGFTNGSLMYYALGYCTSVEEFENILIKTNQTGRKTRANFGLIDSTGAAVIYETSGKEFWKYDANNSSQSPTGYVIRTNFSFAGGSSVGIERYKRTISLIETLIQQNELSYQSIIKKHFRDFSNEQSKPVNIPFKNRWYGSKPFGYVNSNYSVCRSISLSASVFHGVLPTESPLTTTMWTALGNPASTLTMPYWAVGVTPSLSQDEIISPLYESAEATKAYLYDDPNNKTYFDSYKLIDDNGFGILNKFLSFEDSLFDEVAAKLKSYQKNELPPNQLLTFEHEIANAGFSVLTGIKLELDKLIKIEVQNEKAWEHINNFKFVDGNILQVISAGKNGEIDLPITNTADFNFGMPGGDDFLVGTQHQLGENSNNAGKFYFPLLLWNNYYKLPVAGEGIYIRLFDSNKLISAENYGNSYLYKISEIKKQQFKPEISEVLRLKPKEHTDELAEKNISEFKLTDNYPNPFNPVTNFNYSIPSEVDVKIEIFNSLGEKVQTLVDEHKTAGEYSVQFNAAGFSSGIYYYRLTADKFVSIKKMLLIK